MKQLLQSKRQLVPLVTFLIIISLIVSCASPAPVQKTTITFAANTFIKGFYPALISLVDEFHKEDPSIVVQLVNPPEEDWTKSDLSGLASAADATLLSPGLERPSPTAAYFKDLSPLMSGDTAFNANDFWPGLLTACQDGQGKSYGLPMGVYGLAVYYDSQAFAAAGLSYPTPGWTWEDFQQDISVLSRQSGNPSGFSFVDSAGFLSSVLAPLTDGVLGTEDGQIDPANLSRQVQGYLDLAKAGSLFSFTQPDEARARLFKGAVPALWIGSLADPSPLDASQLARQVYGLAPFPVAANRSSEHTSSQLPVCGVISSASTHPSEAWAWLDFLTRQKPESTTPSQVIPQIPARQSVADKSGYWASFSPQAAEAVQFSLAHGWYGSLYPDALDQVAGALNLALAGKQDLTLALTQAMGLPPAATATPGMVASVVTPVPTQSTSGGTVTITYAAPAMPAGDKTFDKLAEAFHRLHPDIVVNVINNDWGCGHGSFADCLKLKPDVFTANFKGFESIEKDRVYVLSLDSFIQAEDPSLLNDFYPGLVDTFTYDGKVYGLPASAALPLLYYNKELLAAKGLTPPSNSWTLDEFLDMATKVASGGGPGVWTKDDFIAEGNGTLKPQIYGATNVDIQILDYLAQGWLDTSVDPPVVNLNQPQVLNALQKLSDLINRGVILYSNNLSYLGLQDVLLTGQVAFWFGSTDVSADGFTQMVSNTVQIGVAPIPEGLNASLELVNGMIQTTQGHFISKDTQYPQACWEWLSFISADPTAFYGVPVRKSVAASSNWEARVGTQTATVYRATLEQVTPYQGPSTSSSDGEIFSITQLFTNILGKVLKGQNPQTVIVAEQKSIDKYMACIAPFINSSTPTETPGVDNSIAIGNCFQQADPWSDFNLGLAIDQCNDLYPYLRKLQFYGKWTKMT